MSSTKRGALLLKDGKIARVTHDNGDGTVVIQGFVGSRASRSTPIPGGMSRTVVDYDAAWTPADGDVRAGDCVRVDSAEPNAPAYYVQSVLRGWLSLRHYRLDETLCAKVERVTQRFELVEGDPSALRGPLRGPVLLNLHDVAWNSAATVQPDRRQAGQSDRAGSTAHRPLARR